MRRWKFGKLAGVAVICIIAGVAVFIGGVLERQEAQVLAKEGVDVTGVVSDKAERKGRKGSSRKYYLTVNYPAGSAPNAGTARKEFKVGEKFYGRTPVGTELGIRCLPSDPTVARLKGDDDDGTELMGVGAILFVIGASCGVAWKVRRDRAAEVARESEREAAEASQKPPA